jgi:clan AA aspartic protease
VPDQVRTLEVEALVDTGATTLILPKDIADRLGLVVYEQRRVKLADGRVVEVPRVGAVRLEILRRDMVCDALVVPEGNVPLIGQIPLEELDLIVDPKSRDLSVNPLSPDLPLLDMLAAS